MEGFEDSSKYKERRGKDRSYLSLGERLNSIVFSEPLCEVKSVIGCTSDVHGHCLSYVCYRILIPIKYFTRSESWFVVSICDYMIFSCGC